MENNKLNIFGLIDPEEFKRKAEAVSNALQSAAVSSPSALLTASGGSSSGTGSSSTGGSGKVFSTQEIQDFVRELIKVQNEYDKLGKAMEALIGSKLIATEVMKQIGEMAAKSPFSLEELGTASKKLVEMGTKA